MKILGIDYGTEHIGIAVGYSESGLAEPLETLSSGKNPQSTIEALIATHHIDTVVVGISEKTSAEQAEQFADRLGKTLKIPIHLADETLSSQEAASKLFHKGRAKRAVIRHAAAAAIILERWMDAQI